jgi:hypothetical protein
LWVAKLEMIWDYHLGQSRIAEKPIKDINLVQKKEKWVTPSAPGFLVLRPTNCAKMIDERKQKWFRSTIGALLLIQQIR